jgi:hypothetical protein
MRDALEERGLGGMASYVTRGDAGLVVADAEQVVKGLSDEDKARLNLDAIIPLPVFTTDLPGGKTVAAVTFACGSLAEFSGNTVGDMEVLKIVVSGDTIPLARAESLREIIASQFVITDGEGGSISPDTMLGEAELFITVAIEDNGALDWDVAPGRIADPLALALKAAEEGASHGGGCGVGFGAISLLAALALRVRKRA